MGNYTNLKDVLRDLRQHGTNILSFRSSRGHLRFEHSVAAGPNKDAIEKSKDSTFLEAYKYVLAVTIIDSIDSFNNVYLTDLFLVLSCDDAGSPKPAWAERARKQIYRPDYVLYHFVHYSTVTKGYLKTYQDAKESGESWYRQYREHSPSERTSDELSQAVMVHTKSINRDMTFNYENGCKYNRTKGWQKCWVAYPWPLPSGNNDKFDKNGMEYNCYINRKVEDYWIPKLKDALLKRKTAIASLR